MATEADQLVRCGVCRRSLLVGERPRLFRDDRVRANVTVCALCVGRAERHGWTPLGEDGEPGPRVPAEAAAVRMRAVSGLQRNLEELRDDLQARRSERQARAAAEAQAERALRAAADRHAAESAQLEAILHEREQRLAEREARVLALEARLEELQGAQESLLRARRREGDAAYLAGIAAEVFNRSPHRDAIAALAARHGEPVVAIAPSGISLPRTVVVAFAWPQGWRRFRVTCDLVTRLFDVADMDHAGDGLARPGGRFAANARWDGERVVVPAPRPATSVPGA